MKILLFATLLSCFLLSCGGRENKTDIFLARSYFDSVRYEMNAGKKIQQKLIDETTRIMLSIKKDTSFTADTRSFQALLDSAKDANVQALQNIQRITEIDPQINYKGKVLEYLSQFSNLYNNEFKQLVVLLDEKSIDKLEKQITLMASKMEAIKENETAVENAKAAFNNKYPVDAEGVAKTNPDFEYVNLADYKYTQASINPGEEISLLSFSGGDDCDEKTIYYRQFIGVVKSTGDTVRILAPCQDYVHEKARGVGYFQKEITIGSLDKTGKQLVVIFNKNQYYLEKMQLPTIIGMIAFKE